jgi:hypothetical protein
MRESFERVRSPGTMAADNAHAGLVPVIARRKIFIMGSLPAGAR